MRFSFSELLALRVGERASNKSCREYSVCSGQCFGMTQRASVVDDGKFMEEMGMFGDGSEDLSEKPEGMTYTEWRLLVREREAKASGKTKKVKPKPSELYKDMYPDEVLNDSSWSRIKRKVGITSTDAKVCCCCCGTGGCLLAIVLVVLLITIASYLVAHYWWVAL